MTSLQMTSDNVLKIAEHLQQPQAQDSRFKPDDDQLALALADEWQDEVKYFQGSWHVYTGGVWERRDDSEVNILIRQFLRSWRSRGVDVTQRRIVNVASMMRDDQYLRDQQVSELQAEGARFINLRNGLYDMEEQRLVPHRRELMMTTQLGFDYQPGAKSPTFNQFLKSSLVKPGTLETDYSMGLLVKQMFGYCMTSRTDLKASFWLYGVPDSGKSTMLSLIRGIMGNLGTTIDLNQLGTKTFMLSEIIGKRVVTFPEVNSNSELSEANYKVMVGGSDEIWADVKNRAAIKFKPIAKFIWAMNEMPRINDRSGATHNRIKLIVFNRSLAAHEKDPTLLGRLLSERAGVFNEAMSGYRELAENGWMLVPQSEDLLAQYRLENDTEQSFIDERCELDPEFKCGSQELYSAYRTWCEENGFRPKNRNRIAADWRRLGLVSMKSDTIFWRGARIKKPPRIL